MNEAAGNTDEALLKMGWARAGELLAALLAYAIIRTGLEIARKYTGHTLPVLPAPVRASVLSLVQQAEALVRRMLGLMAFGYEQTLESPHGERSRTTRACAFPPPGSTSLTMRGKGAALKLRTPAFRLFEYIPPLDCHDEPPPPPVRRGRRVRCDDRLFRRIRALEGVLKHRARAARRLARWLSKRPRLTNIRGALAPGVAHDDAVAGLVHDLTDALRTTAWARAGPDHFKPSTIHDRPAPRPKRGPVLVHVPFRQGLVWR